MDHKVSKDMISSGMIPSGEKTQADLGRIQYGSAPSPSSLMDAYTSIYEHHKKDADGNTIPHEGEELNETLMGAVAKGLRGASKVSKNLATSAAKADKSIKAQGGLKNIAQKKLQSAKTKLAPTSGQKQALLGRTTAGKITRGVGALAAANIAGRMAGGGDKPNRGYDGYSNNPEYLNFDYAPDGDTISEDLFDALKFLLTEEGYDEKTTMKIIASMDTDFINESLSEENLNELAPLLALAPLIAKGAMAAKAGLAAAKATKVGMAAVKGAKALGAAGKAFGKGLTTAGAKGASASKITTSGGKLASGTAKVGKAQRAGQMVRGAGAAMKNNPMNTAMTASVAPSLIPQGAPPTPQTQRTATSGKRTAGMQRMDLDLFDVVKGQLLDEGLTEEECNDVMTTLTLEEINETLQLDEITGKLAMKASRAADMKRAQLAKAGDKAGAAAKASQASRLYKGGAKRNIAKQDLSKPLNPQPTNYPKGKGASYQEKPGM